MALIFTKTVCMAAHTVKASLPWLVVIWAVSDLDFEVKDNESQD